ncbi:unnamed protein product [Diplocarpon coronariae]
MEPARDPWNISRSAADTTVEEIEPTAENSLFSSADRPVIDATFVSAMAEHCHQGSLLQFSASTPIFAIAASARHPGAPLPVWLTALSPTVTYANNFGLVLMISANSGTDEMILVAPHRIYFMEPSINALANIVKMLAFVAPLNDSNTAGKVFEPPILVEVNNRGSFLLT